MEKPYRESSMKQVPNSATRTFPNFSGSEEHKFEPTRVKKPFSSRITSKPNPNPNPSTIPANVYSREDIANIISSNTSHVTPPQRLLSCELIFTEDSSALLQVLNKLYLTAADHEFVPSKTYPGRIASHVMSARGRGRGRGIDFIEGFGGASSSESSGRCSSFRSQSWRTTFASGSTELSAYSRRRFLSDCSHNDTGSEAMSESSRDARPDWQYFPDDETFDQESWEQPIQNEIGKVSCESTVQPQITEGKTLSWYDTTSFIQSKRGPDFDRANVTNFKSIDSHATRKCSSGGESNVFSPLNPGNEDATCSTSVANNSDSNITNQNDNTEKSHNFSNGFESHELTSKNLTSDSQDLNHLWYYVDPKGNTQGPFLSDQMDNWYCRNFFPPTLPIWRKCDPERFKLAYLLSITDTSNEPFTVGAGRLLSSRDPVCSHISQNLDNDFCEAQEVFYSQNDSEMRSDTTMQSTKTSLNEEIHAERYPHSKEIEEGQPISYDSTSHTQHNISEDHAKKPHSHSTNEEVTHNTPLVPTVDGVTAAPVLQSDSNNLLSDSGEGRSQPGIQNIWLNRSINCTDKIDNAILNTPRSPIQAALPHLLNNENSVNHSTSPIPTQQLQQADKTVERKIHTTNDEPKMDTAGVSEDNSGWKRVGLSKRKATFKKASQSESKNSEWQEKEPFLPGTKSHNNDLEMSFYRSKLDELDSFSRSRQIVQLPTPNQFPPPQTATPKVVNFTNILTEQSKEEEEHSLDALKKSISLTQLRHPTNQNKNKTWISCPTDNTSSSFLAIESEQKKNIKNDNTSADKIQLKELQTTNQPVNAPTWARVTKSHPECSEITPVAYESSASKKSCNPQPSAPIKVSESLKTQPRAESVNLIKQKRIEKSQTMNSVPDSIILSPTCYEWSFKEINDLNKHVDPQTIISLLQEFNGLFEMSQLAFEMLGNAERTKTLCKRIHEDVTKFKKMQQRTANVDEEWTKVSKKSGKAMKKKGKFP